MYKLVNLFAAGEMDCMWNVIFLIPISYVVFTIRQ